MKPIERLNLLKELGQISASLPSLAMLAKLKKLARLREIVAQLGGAQQPAIDPNIGRKWQSDLGEVTITRAANGEEMARLGLKSAYVAHFAKRGNLSIIDASKLEATIARDIENKASNDALESKREALAAEIDAREAKQAAEKRAEEAPLDEFIAAAKYSPMRAGQARKALLGLIRSNFKITKYYEYIEKLVAEGATPSTREEDKIKELTNSKSNRMTNEEQRAHAKKVADGGKVTVYKVGNSIVTFFGHAYAGYLVGRNAVTHDLTTRGGILAALSEVIKSPDATLEDRFVYASFGSGPVEILGAGLLAGYQDKTAEAGDADIVAYKGLLDKINEFNKTTSGTAQDYINENFDRVAKELGRDEIESKFSAIRKRVEELPASEVGAWLESTYKPAKQEYEKALVRLQSALMARLTAEANLSVETRKQQAGVADAFDAMKQGGQRLIDELLAKSPVSADQAKALVKERVTVSASAKARLKRDGYKTDLEQDIADFMQITGGKLHKVAIETKGHRRANAPGIGEMREQTIMLDGNFTKGTLWHELGHHLEFDPVCNRLANEFLIKRRESEKLYSLRSLTGSKGYDSTEMAYKDAFIAPYVGKHYKSGITEVFSMGVEQLATPEKALAFAAKDPEHYALIANYISKKRCKASDVLISAALQLIGKKADDKSAAISEADSVVIDTASAWWADAFKGYDGFQVEEVRDYFMRGTKHMSKNLVFYGEYGAKKIFQGLVKVGGGRLVKGFCVAEVSPSFIEVRNDSYRPGKKILAMDWLPLRYVAGGLPELKLYLFNQGKKA